MEEKNKSQILEEILKAKESKQKMSFDEQYAEFEKFINENNCNIKKEDNNG